MLKRHAILLSVLAVAVSTAQLRAQTAPLPKPTTSASTAPAHQTTPAPTSDPNPEADTPASPNQPQPQIVVADPPAAPNTWTWHDKILWGAILVLVILGYLGVILGLRTLKVIQRQADFGVQAAQAALQCANAALESSQAIVDSGRPWIVISVEPFVGTESGFRVMATNRGRTPARITAKADCAVIAADEAKLPESPDYSVGKSSTPFEPIILLPGESAGIRLFRRSDVRALCETDEQVKSLEKWEQKLYLFGRVRYRDLISPLDQPDHETAWCCWYVFNDKDALVISGPPEYNKHT